MTEDRVDYDKYLGTTLKGDVDIKLSPMWVEEAIERKIDIGTIKSANARDVTLTTTYEQRKGILRQALIDASDTEEFEMLRRLAAKRRAAIRVVRKLRLRLMD